jgi:ribosomal protein L29
MPSNQEECAMNKSNINEYRALDKEGLLIKLLELNKILFSIKQKKSLEREIKQNHLIKKHRRDIARVKTLLTIKNNTL